MSFNFGERNHWIGAKTGRKMLRNFCIPFPSMFLGWYIKRNKLSLGVCFMLASEFNGFFNGKRGSTWLFHLSTNINAADL